MAIIGDISNSILLTIKKMLGYSQDNTAFDTDIIVFINTRIARLIQLGIGPSTGFRIHSAEETWADFLGEESPYTESAKEYIYLKSKLVFDTPSNSAIITALKESAAEIEWQLKLDSETEENNQNDS